MSPFPPPLPDRPVSRANPARVVTLVLLGGVWLGVTVVADFFAFMMFAFADSPDSASAAKLMIVPVFIWFAIAFVAGAALIYFGRWWSILIAFVLAISPPVLVFVGYNLLSGSSGRANLPPPTTGPVNPEPPGKFKPPPMTPPKQPDFRQYIPREPPKPPSSQPAQ